MMSRRSNTTKCISKFFFSTPSIAVIIDPTASKVASLLPGEMIVSPSSEEKPFFGKELFTEFK